nr:MAG TPA: hypothetical protein [Caudoviricetes sp.]
MYKNNTTKCLYIKDFVKSIKSILRFYKKKLLKK